MAPALLLHDRKRWYSHETPVLPPLLTNAPVLPATAVSAVRALCGQWAQLFPLTPRAHVTQARREWKRDRYPDIWLSGIGGVQTYRRCRDTGSLRKRKPTRTDEVFIHPYVGSHACVTGGT